METHQPLAVVDQRFCFPQQTVLVMQEQLGAFRNDNFAISDTQNRPYFNLVAAPSLSMAAPRKLMDVYNTPVVSMERKVPSMRGTWLVNRADGVRVATVRPAMGMSPSINVYLNDGDEQEDFVLAGDFRAKSFNIVQVHHGRGQRVIATIKKESRRANAQAFLMSVMTDASKYFITIEPGVDAAFVVALAILCDEVFHDERR